MTTKKIAYVKFNPFGADFPKAREINTTQMNEHKTKSFDVVK